LQAWLLLPCQVRLLQGQQLHLLPDAHLLPANGQAQVKYKKDCFQVKSKFITDQ
jgi:hypothetical protein